MRSTLAILGLIAASVLTSACNTMEGFGEDIQTGGRKLERSADENKGQDSQATDTGRYSY
jgi:entericidin B